MTVEGVYPNANAAMSELSPVLKPDVQLRMIALGNPHDNYGVEKLWSLSGGASATSSATWIPYFAHSGSRSQIKKSGSSGASTSTSPRNERKPSSAPRALHSGTWTKPHAVLASNEERQSALWNG